MLGVEVRRILSTGVQGVRIGTLPTRARVAFAGTEHVGAAGAAEGETWSPLSTYGPALSPPGGTLALLAPVTVACAYTYGTRTEVCV